MIVRYKCFETNSSSTHALCIGKGLKLKSPIELILDYKTKYKSDDIMDLTYDYLPISNQSVKRKMKYDFMYPVRTRKQELDTLDNTDTKYEKLYKEYTEYKEEREKIWKDERSYLELCKGYTYDRFNDNTKLIYLRRFENSTRMFRIYETVESKLNFVWTCLISRLNGTVYTDNRQYLCDGKELVEKFINLLQSNGFILEFLDAELSKEKVKDTDKGYNKPKLLGTLNDGTNIIGVETYGYYPLEELYYILQDETLFFNLIFGNSKIYTGSDEWDTFEDLSFDNYIFKYVGGSDSDNCCHTNIFKYEPPKLLGTYINGNIKTSIYNDGTRIRKLQPENLYYKDNMFNTDIFKKTEIELMEPKFPESIDLKITNYCSNNCEFCYANCNTEGKHASLDFIKDILWQMKPYTEVAIGGGNALSHPNLVEMLEYAKRQNIICNITLKDMDIINKSDTVINLLQKDLIKCVGISPTNVDTLHKAINIVNEGAWDSYILHLIVGIHDMKFLQDIYDNKHNIGTIDKVLFLGYKDIGRGQTYNEKHKKQIEKNIQEMEECIKNNHLPFGGDVISFDNLAIEQLHLDTIKNFNKLYQGKDGQFSFYIDAVEQTYAKSSLSKDNDYFNRYTTLERILEDFREEE